jgi:hypothetical protein
MNRRRVWRKDGTGKIHAIDSRRLYRTYCGKLLKAKDYDHKRNDIEVTCKTCKRIMDKVGAK